MKKIEEIRTALEERKDRSAWNKGVTVYALELLEVYEERADRTAGKNGSTCRQERYTKHQEDCQL